MKALLDSNIFISYLLPRRETEQSQTIRSIVEGGIAGKYTIVLPQMLLKEMQKKVAEKPYLKEHISNQDIEAFIAILSASCELIPTIPDAIPTVTRDPKDDYLLVYATISRCDFLVTGDRNLLDIQKIDRLSIITPGEFAEMLV